MKSSLAYTEDELEKLADQAVVPVSQNKKQIEDSESDCETD